MAEFKKKMNDRNPKEVLTENERAYMDFILKQEYNTEGKPMMKNYVKKIGTAANFGKRKIKVFDAAKDMAKKMASVGYDWQNPPAQPNVAQLKMFVSVLENQLQSVSRFDRIINYTEKQKKELRKEIMKDGYKTRSGRTIALQYYAH